MRLHEWLACVKTEWFPGNQLLTSSVCWFLRGHSHKRRPDKFTPTNTQINTRWCKAFIILGTKPTHIYKKDKNAKKGFSLSDVRVSQNLPSAVPQCPVLPGFSEPPPGVSRTSFVNVPYKRRHWVIYQEIILSSHKKREYTKYEKPKIII